MVPLLVEEVSRGLEEKVGHIVESYVEFSQIIGEVDLPRNSPGRQRLLISALIVTVLAVDQEVIAAV